ncbi:MAG: tRNA lysidine(34) synthetase TilS [Candidatus Cryptobacteroides sp.]|nr:tRNA lysidine(34) synthetase TilS [Candidatus Cryptobacteroides sp.]
MLLVAVSGGIDSMCLMEKVRQEGGPFAVAHCNFGLRGAESDADEAFVREQAARHGIPCHVKQFDTEAFASAEGISIEMAARRLRYHWFGELCREHGYTAVAVAHNANDNAETLILNLLRGTGLKGITGMKAAGYIPDPDFGDIPLLRPLLEMTREEIVAFAREHGLNWREDSTNAQTDYKRNKIRNLVFPVFATINPSFVQTLNRDMERFAEELNLILKNGQNQGRAMAHASKPMATLGRVRGRGPRPQAVGGTRSEATKGLEACATAREYTLVEEEWDGTEAVKQPEGVLILDAEKVGAYVEGAWESGDWIKPLGAPGRKKLQDWFTDHHIPADEKPFVPLLKSVAEPHHVLAVIPCCIDHSVRVTATTRRILRISIKNG